MPWCDDCARFWNPNSLSVDGTCPTCGRPVGAIGSQAVDGSVVPDRAPWHFKLLVGMAAVYLVWRLVQMVGWLV